MAVDTTQLMQRDERGRFLTRPVNSAPPITSETAHQFHEMRRRKKQDTVLATANALAVLEASKAPEQIREIVGNDDMSGVRAIALGRMRAAIDSDSPYGNGAADWITANAGLAEPKQATQEQTVTHVMDVSPALVALVAQVRQYALQAGAVDTYATQADTE